MILAAVKILNLSAMNYDFDVPLTKSKHQFETNQKVSSNC